MHDLPKLDKLKEQVAKNMLAQACNAVDVKSVSSKLMQQNQRESWEREGSGLFRTGRYISQVIDYGGTTHFKSGSGSNNRRLEHHWKEEKGNECVQDSLPR